MMVLRLFSMALRDGLRLWWLAPAIALLAIVPEFVQHIAEVKLGMFESRAAFAELATDPKRIWWGVPKVLAVVLAMLFATRYWLLAPQGQRWWSARGILWGPLLIATVISLSPALAAALPIGETAQAIVGLVLMLATLPTIAYATGALLGDQAMTLKAAYSSGWLTSVRVAIFAMAIFVPLQWLHTQDHYWALGSHSPAIWGILIWDSLVVGLIATLAGTAMHHAYRAKELYAGLSLAR